MTDALSCKDDRMDNELTSILFCFAHNQVPSNFVIVPLPRKIISWLTLLLSKLPVKEQYREVHTRTRLRCSKDGFNIADPLDSTTLTLTNLTSTRESLMGTFAMTMCEGQFSRDYGQLAEGIVHGAISYVVLTFRENGWPNLTKDEDMELGFLSHRLYRSFKNEDPKVAHQKAVPISDI